MRAGCRRFCSKLAAHGKLDEDALTVNGKTIGENVKGAPNWNTEVIRNYDNPLVESGGIAVLRGNLCPDGAVLKPSAASPASDEASRSGGGLRRHRALQGAHRRSEPRDRREQRDGAQELRAARLPRHGRSRQHGPARRSCWPRASRHGAHQRCAHERYRIWNGRAACESGGSARRTAGAWCARATGSRSMWRRVHLLSKSMMPSWRVAVPSGSLPYPQ